MLVLTRKQNETIHIGENIVVKVVRTGRNTVKIGIEAPADVRILRSEICEAEEDEDETPGEQKCDDYLGSPYANVA